MGDSKPAGTSCSDKKAKASILDDDIGNKMLNSWKSISVAEGSMDFDLEPTIKSKKKDFGFDKLDMDFGLGDDFGKISSFKMDMSDLDFSFSPKKNLKGKDKTEEDSGSKKGAKDRFNFSFDFDSISNFDFDTSLSKADKKSSKHKDSERQVVEKTDCEGSVIQDSEITVVDLIRNPRKFQASSTVNTAEAHSLVCDQDTLMMENQPLSSSHSSDKAFLPDTGTSPDILAGGEGTKTCPDSPIAQQQSSIQESDVPSRPNISLCKDSIEVSLNDSSLSETKVNTHFGEEERTLSSEVVVLRYDHQSSPMSSPRLTSGPPEINHDETKIVTETSSSDAKVDSPVGEEQSISAEELVSSVCPLVTSPESAPAQTSESLKDTNSGNIISSKNFVINEESYGGVSNLHSSFPSASKGIHHDKTVLIEMKTQLSPALSRRVTGDELTLDKDIEPKSMQSKFFRRSGELDPQNHKPSAYPKATSTVSSDNLRAGSLYVRKEGSASDVQMGIIAGVDVASEKEPQSVQTKFFSKSSAIDPQNHKAAAFKKLTSSKTIDTLRSGYSCGRREESASGVPSGISAGDDVLSLLKVVQRESTLQKSQAVFKTSENSVQILSPISSEELKRKSQKCENPKATSGSGCTISFRHISAAKDKSVPPKAILRTLDMVDPRSSRSLEERPNQSLSSAMKDIKPLMAFKQKIPDNVTPKVTAPVVTVNQKPGTPTLKRKQAPTGVFFHEIPLKRLSQSPKDSSYKSMSERKSQEESRDQDSVVKVNTKDHFADISRIPKLDTLGEMKFSDYENPSVMESYGNVEKAEAYGKDLEDLCSMLKKKNEEARELLVRAVVNNNNLLLLSHPMHDQKIRSVQKLANELMSLKILASSG